ncbi:hypothetical protein BMS3Abin10_01550 [bacterium BMS3Abin10]|nr:hypothetical protein BMS3Abin10_01550 [bacterium BMS3Abin10]GBE37607.1 hypothetical protein BMS3Bbin08_00197 [bacterium BMS3Bbin08]
MSINSVQMNADQQLPFLLAMILDLQISFKHIYTLHGLHH